MKVLLWLSNFKPFVYPTNVMGGGMERVEFQQIRALQESGVELTLAASTDSVIEGIDHVTVPTTSTIGGMYRTTRAIDALDPLIDDFDFVLTNKNLSVSPWSPRAETLKRWAPKLRTINHIDDNFPSSWGGVSNLLLNKFLIPHGLRHAHVSPHARESWEGIAEKIMSGKAFNKHPKYAEFLREHQSLANTDQYEVMVTDDSFLPLEQIGDGKHLFHAARPCPDKGGILTCKVLDHRAQEESRGEVFCTHPATDKERANLERMLEIWPDIKLGRPHGELIQSLATARAFILPTSIETAGSIVTFEAAAHGVPCVTSSIWSDRYLKPYGLLYKFKPRTIKCLNTALDKALEEVPSNREWRIETAKRVRQDYSWESYRSQLMDFLS